MPFQFDVDIYNAAMLSCQILHGNRKIQYEYLLRSLELFFRVEKKLPNHPRLLVMATCFVVSDVYGAQNLLSDNDNFCLWFSKSHAKIFFQTDHAQAPPGAQL